MVRKAEPQMPSVSTKKGKKPESRYNAATLRRLIKEGKDAKAIMAEMGITHKQVLKHHIFRLIDTDGCYYKVPGLSDQNLRKAFINSKGELRLRMGNIDFGNMPLTPDTEFDVEVIGNQIVLTNLSMESNGNANATVAADSTAAEMVTAPVDDEQL